jgi:hypothetical protein
LLDTRRRVLEASGYQVYVATEFSEIERITSIKEISLIIVCHSVSMEDCGRVLNFASSRLPAIESLILVTHASNWPVGMRVEVMYVMDGPAKLVSTVGRLVNHPSSGTP